MNESLYPFVNHTTYDLKALGAMNRLAELSVRREKSRRTKGICGVLGLIGLVAFSFDFSIASKSLSVFFSFPIIP